MWTSLPAPIRLAIAGLMAMAALIAGAIVARARSRTSSREAPIATVSSAPVASARPHERPTETAAAAGSSRPPSDATPPSGDAREARAQLRTELSFARYQSATDAFERLVALDPRAADDRETRGDIIELSMRVMLLTGDQPDRVFDAISTKLGTTGIDILYELLTTRGGSRAAARAEDLLKDEKIRARGTPAFRIAYELRTARGCDERRALLARAKTDGDGRALGQLQLLNRRCRRDATSCCLQNDPDLRDAMDAIKARL